MPPGLRESPGGSREGGQKERSDAGAKALEESPIKKQRPSGSLRESYRILRAIRFAQRRANRLRWSPSDARRFCHIYQLSTILSRYFVKKITGDYNCLLLLALCHRPICEF